MESLLEEGTQGGIEEGARQMLDKVESGNMKALFDYDWSKVVDQFKKQGVESMPAVFGITALGGTAAGVADRVQQRAAPKLLAGTTRRSACMRPLTITELLVRPLATMRVTPSAEVNASMIFPAWRAAAWQSRSMSPMVSR